MFWREFVIVSISTLSAIWKKGESLRRDVWTCTTDVERVPWGVDISGGRVKFNKKRLAV